MFKRAPDHTKLLCDIGEMSTLFTDSTSLESFLQKIVEMIASHMNSDVCSIYLYDVRNQDLILRATTGLNKDFIGKLRLKLGEGLTGLALKELRPICERHASRNPHFRYFPGLGEEKFESFLAVPIQRGTIMIGAIVIQNAEKDYFKEEDIRVLKAITSQLANTVETTRFIMTMEEEKSVVTEHPQTKPLTFIKGKAGAPGYAYAPVVVLSDEASLRMPLDGKYHRQYSVDEFHQALKQTEIQLESLQQNIEEKLSDVASLIFTAQILMLKDQAFLNTMMDFITSGVNPPEAIVQATDIYVKKFNQIENPYFQEKSHDIRDIGTRILENLVGDGKEKPKLKEKIVIARELFPSDVLKLYSQNVKGIILLSGGATSHLSILTRSLEIPLIIADVEALISLEQSTPVILDAEHGNIYINPSSDIISSFSEKEYTSLNAAKIKSKIKSETFTADGTRIILMANINLLGDAKNAIEYKAEGVGIYRTEFPFIIRNNFPTEEEQYVIYKKLIDQMAGREVTFRTLDIGGDKVLSYFDYHLKEKNPYLGMRSIRFSLKHTDIFIQQIRAILRAASHAPVRIMFPMISSRDEFREAKSIVLRSMKDLKKEGISFQHKPEMGMMVELPAVLEIIDELARDVDFFSIGTNDFIQYMLAVDRTNEKVADLYIPHHPAVLRGLKKVIDAAIKHKIDVSICGDMSHEIKYLPYLLGMGVRKISVDAQYIPSIQTAIEKLHIKNAQKDTKLILTKSRLSEINRIIK